MSATYTRLKDESWGIRIVGPAPSPGTQVTVSKRDGSSKVETIAKIVWQGNDVTLCSIAPATSQASTAAPRVSTPTPRRRNGCSCRDDCCSGGRCRCSSECNCKGGPIYDC